MKYSELKKRIKKHTWWHEEASMVLQTVLWAWHGFIEQYKYGHPKYLTIGIFFQQKDFGHEFTSKEEKAEAFEYIIQKLLRQPKYVSNLHKKWISWQPKLLSLANEVEELTDKPFNFKVAGHTYKKFLKYTLSFMCPAVSIENADVYTDQIIFDDVTNEFPNLPKHKIQELVFTLTAPTSLGYAGREQRDLLKTAIEYKNKAQKTQPRYFKQLETAHPGIARKLYVLSRKYYWVNNNYAATKILTPDYFLNRVKVLSRKPIKQLRNELREIEIRPIQVKNQQSKLRQQLKLSRRMNTIFNLLSEYTIWQDERKEWSMRMSHYILNFWKWWSQNTGVLYQYLIGLGWSEMEKYFKTGKLPSEKELKNRIKFSVYVAERKGKGIVGEVVSGKPARDLFKTILKRFEVGTELQGVVASAPKKVIKGAVQIVTDFSKQKFITGRILVTNMTRPDSMPYVRKSIGIITNEGGVTTHAAIVSRELKIPCIIGTKHATKLLKNGDRVEMDLESGKITILK